MGWGRKRLAVLFGGLLAVLVLGVTNTAMAQDRPTGSLVPRPAQPTRGAIANLTADDLQRGKTQAPGLLKAAGVQCTVTQAAYLGASAARDAKGNKVDGDELYETACAEGLGYIIDVAKLGPPVASDCISTAQDGRLSCMLPGNRHPPATLNPYVKAAGVDCRAQRARYIGKDDKLHLRRFEIGCEGSGGYVLDIPSADGSGRPATAVSCLQLETACTFTPHAVSVAMLANRISKTLGNDCRIADARYVGYLSASHQDMYEFACQTGHDGLLVAFDSTETIRRNLACAEGGQIGVTCQLKPSDKPDPRIVQAQAAGTAAPRAITKPEWIRLPTGADFAAVYPARARASRIAGQASLSCQITTAGLLEDCFIADESPVGYGFGDAALKISTKFRMKPATGNGVPVRAYIFIPIAFGLR